MPREPGEYRCLQKAAVTELLDFDPADPRVVHTCKKGEHVEMVTDHPQRQTTDHRCPDHHN